MAAITDLDGSDKPRNMNASKVATAFVYASPNSNLVKIACYREAAADSMTGGTT